jgi:SAM-dependent methyltransferase
MSYDSVAATYQRVAVPAFRRMAEDLIDAVQPAPGERILDLGTGTGLVAGLVKPAVAPTGTVIGVDPSMGMLQHASRNTALPVIVASAPGLPIATASVDAVVANLVLSHLPDLSAGMADIARVIRVGGRIGISAWAPDVAAGPGQDRVEADQIVARVKEECELHVPPPRRDAVPFEEWLQDRDHLLEIMEQAGIEPPSTELHRYERAVTVDEFLSGWGSQSRYLRHTIGEQRWNSFVRHAADALRERFSGTISCVNDAWIVVGHKA